jgi:peptidoglycan/LPS O-acetylase OafA/YrhL
MTKPTRNDDSAMTRRLDIQGLRAVAVILVIVNHLVGWPTGGFVGVDVFFVISGFLITGLLLREKEETGRISFAQFYARRIKRILPAALTVAIATVVTSFLIFSLPRAQEILTDGLWASVFAGNWRFIATGTNYMHANDAMSPLQHYWSLSVEEQFYLIWPLLMVVILSGVRQGVRRRVALVLAAITAASLAWAFIETANQPTWAYFSTTSRAWELGLGALLACVAPLAARVPVVVRPLLAWAGIGALAVSVLLISSETPFPAPGALLPVLATLAILAAGVGGTPRFSAPLTNPVSVYLGTISYSLYLWHLPVIVFVSAFHPQREIEYVLLSVALILVLSVLSYHWVEQPLRHSSWKPSARHTRTIRRASRMRKIALASLAAATIGLLVVTYNYRLPEQGRATGETSSFFENVPLSDAQIDRTAAIDEALTAEEWPELEPSIDELGKESRASEWIEDGCLGLEQSLKLSPEQHAERCVYGDANAENTIAILGDSTAISYVPALRAAIGDNWNVQVYTMSTCPWADVEGLLSDGSDHYPCENFRDWSIDQILDQQPERVVLTAAPLSVTRFASGSSGTEALEEYRDGLHATLDDLAGLDVYLLDPPPDLVPLAECAIVGSVPEDCALSPNQNYVEVTTVIREVAADYPDMNIVPTIAWFCSAAGTCPPFIGTTPTLADGTHLSEAASQELGPLVRDALALER